MIDIADMVLEKWSKGRNVLLYGTPATGKTQVISQMFHRLEKSSVSSKGIILDLETEDELPFTRPREELPIPQPVKVIWTTFHQSYSYEDFVIGLRPFHIDGSVQLIPCAGVFLDAALELNSSSEFKSVVIFIDEINRGNAAKIFGEFMTFLDFDYREEGSFPIPLPLRQILFKDGRSEEIQRLNGEKVTISRNFLFPKNIYIVATMNSVDRAVVPIDSAFARRFDRIEMRPNLPLLAQYWSLKEQLLSLDRKENNSWHEMSVFETTYRILERLNNEIAFDLGSEFELGHGLFMSLQKTNDDDDSIEAWLQLAHIWDEVVYPQLEDKFAGREYKLIDILKVDKAPSNYAWRLRYLPNKDEEMQVLQPVMIHTLPVDIIKLSLRWLAI